MLISVERLQDNWSSGFIETVQWLGCPSKNGAGQWKWYQQGIRLLDTLVIHLAINTEPSLQADLL